MTQLKGGIIALNNIIHSLPYSEEKVAQYILQNPEDSILLTALELGRNSQTSSSAVIRLCKSLRYKGFQELKLRVAGDLKAENSNEYRDIHPNEPYKDIINKVTTNTVKAVNETVDLIHSDRLENAVETLTKAKSILFIGFGASHLSAVDAEQKFLRIGKQVYSFSDVHMAATAIANKGPEDLVVGISFSGSTHEVATLLKLAQDKDVKTMSITKYGNSLVQNYADIELYTSTGKEATFRSGATSSRIAQLHIIDILFMCIASKEYEKNIKYLDETREAISFLKQKHFN